MFNNFKFIAMFQKFNNSFNFQSENKEFSAICVDFIIRRLGGISRTVYQ
jgi:hypothetical protein